MTYLVRYTTWHGRRVHSSSRRIEAANPYLAREEVADQLRKDPSVDAYIMQPPTKVENP